MTIKIDEAFALIDEGRFTDLFMRLLGWSRPDLSPIDVVVEEKTYVLINVAAYRGVRVFSCSEIPMRRVQRLIDHEVRKKATERLIIYSASGKQEWLWPQAVGSSETGITRLTTHEHFIGRTTTSLMQRLEMIRIGINETPTVIQLLERLRQAFDSQKVTKKFFNEFTSERKLLSSSIKGKLDDGEKEWYGALLMNRLMFIYFIQRKGFLDGDLNYLRNRLVEVKMINGKNKFYEFYKDLLIPLFHAGLGTHNGLLTLDPEIQDLIGDVPYINGGIFAPHQLEESSRSIRIPDAIFENIFDLFDQYQWHLDTRPTGNPNEINPDVLGYIFEQFINQKSEGKNDSDSDKGAFYTAEDISRYMASSTIIPIFLERLPSANLSVINTMIAKDPDRYIWDSMRHGAAGKSIYEKNLSSIGFERPGGEEGLSGESWYEVSDRLRQYSSIKSKLQDEKFSSYDDYITLNLDIEAITLDHLDLHSDKLDTTFLWESLSSIRVIDPTCGSGAFLFAALKQFLPLYQAVLDAARDGKSQSPSEKMDKILDEISRHPSEEYYLLKHIALNNLYGVDIMPEAIEIARLRLFLALVSTIERREQLEPLPDLDFNIKSGNTLVGAVDPEEILDASFQLYASSQIEIINEKARSVGEYYKDFRLAQELNDSKKVLKARTKLIEVTNETKSIVNKHWYEIKEIDQNYEEWIRSHQPFHWFIEFPEVHFSGGFDAVIGNPPYVQKSKVTSYTFSGFKTDRAPDIFAPVMERAVKLTKKDGRLSMIVPLKLSWGSKFADIREILSTNFQNIWVSTYGIIPARLFPGLEIRNTIFLGSHSENNSGIYASVYNKWNAEFRPHLFNTLKYGKYIDRPTDRWPKVGHESLMPFAFQTGQTLFYSCRTSVTSHRVGFKEISGYWLSVFREDPPALDGKRKPAVQTKVGSLYFSSEEDAFAAMAIMSGRIMFMWWVLHGDEFDSPASTFTSFPLCLDQIALDDRKALSKIGKKLHNAIMKPGNHLLWTPYAGLWMGNYDMNQLRIITDEADSVIRKYVHLDDESTWIDFNVELAHFMKIGRERPGTVRGPHPTRDR